MSFTGKYSVYVLQSLSDKNNYVGLSSNIATRLKMHNAGKVHSTKHSRPFILAYQKQAGSLQEARKREKYLKSSAGKRFLYHVFPTPNK